MGSSDASSDRLSSDIAAGIPTQRSPLEPVAQLVRLDVLEHHTKHDAEPTSTRARVDVIDGPRVSQTQSLYGRVSAFNRLPVTAIAAT